MSLKITKAGLLDTVQDGGRPGYQHLGINPGGAMDKFAAALANALLGKDLQAPVIEMHFPAAQLLFLHPAIICLAGADFTAMINGKAVPPCQPVAVPAHAGLQFKRRCSGTRCYLALLNELAVKPWLNSYSTNLKAAAGGYSGRALATNDELDFTGVTFGKVNERVLLPWRYPAAVGSIHEIAFVPGPEWGWLTEQSQYDFLNQPFFITPASDRMGYRLRGEGLKLTRNEQLVSSPVTFGTVQLLPNGQTIVLMADHQTTGGYPRIANVISAHLPWLAQMSPGETFRFTPVTINAAEEKAIAQHKLLAGLQNTCNLKMKNWVDAHRH